ncbi:hypothetical protein ANN_25550, partial [Periplaneta americana]
VLVIKFKMLDIFKRLARVFKRRRVQTDSLVFRLHYSVTVAFLLLFCVIVTFNQYFRKPLTCSEVGSKDSNMVDEFCLTRSKYVSPELPNLREIVHPGITFNDRDRKMISLKYYQWIFIYLFFQVRMSDVLYEHIIRREILVFGRDQGVQETPRPHRQSGVQTAPPRHRGIPAAVLSDRGLEPVRAKADCLQQRLLPENLLNEYCWTHSTFTAEDSYRKKVGVEVPFPGLGPSRGARESKTKIQRYYQWVFICLFFQAVLFYIPRFLWKNWEGGKLRALRLDLDVGLLSADEKADKKRLLLNYLYEHRNTHTWWTYRYFLCEVLALVNVFSQMFLMNRFLDGEFWSYGSKVLDFLESDEEDRVDPMIYVFPRVAKCIFYRFGPSETVERHDSLCVLPLNVLNEKIYVFLWFWLVMLLVITSGWILFRLVTIFSRRTRILIFGIRFGFIPKISVHKLVAHIGVGDWFLLCMVGENADSVSFNEVINALAEKMDHHTYNALELRVV